MSSATNSSAYPLARGSKSRLTPSAPRSRMAAAICLARVSRAEPLPSSARWTFAWAVVQANTLTVSTTRRAVLVGARDDRREVGARPATPAGRVRAVAILLAQVPVAIGPDREVGDGRQDGVVDLGRRARELPVGQEAEHLAAEAGGGGEVDVGRGGRRGVGDAGRVDGRPAAGAVDRRAGPAPVGPSVASFVGPVDPAPLAHRLPWGLAAISRPVALPAGSAAGGRPSTGQRSRATRREPDGDATAGLEVDPVVLVRHRLLVGDRRGGGRARPSSRHRSRREPPGPRAAATWIHGDRRVELRGAALRDRSARRRPPRPAPATRRRPAPRRAPARRSGARQRAGSGVAARPSSAAGRRASPRVGPTPAPVPDPLTDRTGEECLR